MPSSNPNPWDNAPLGYHAEFISNERRDQLILDGTTFQVHWIHPEDTPYGRKVYVDIQVGDGDEYWTLAFRGGDPRHPRMPLLNHLRKFIEDNPDTPVFARLVSVGSGYILAQPGQPQA